MGYTRRIFSGGGLSSIGVPREDWAHLGLTTTVDSGPATAVGRTLELRLSEDDINWIISILAADKRFGDRMAEVLAYKAALLADAATGSVMRRLGVDSGPLRSKLREYMRELVALDDSMKRHPAGGKTN